MAEWHNTSCIKLFAFNAYLETTYKLKEGNIASVFKMEGWLRLNRANEN